MLTKKTELFSLILLSHVSLICVIIKVAMSVCGLVCVSAGRLLPGDPRDPVIGVELLPIPSSPMITS